MHTADANGPRWDLQRALWESVQPGQTELSRNDFSAHCAAFAATHVWVDSNDPRPPREIARPQPASQVGIVSCVSPRIRLQIRSASKLCSALSVKPVMMEAATVAWRLWIISEQAQLAQCAASLVLTALPKPRLPSENGSVVSHFVLSASSAVPISRRRHCLTFSSSLPANRCASCGLTIKWNKPSCLDDCHGGDPVQENCMFSGFGFEFSHDELLRADCGAQHSQDPDDPLADRDQLSRKCLLV